MNFSDILALAKQGYKPADIKELLAIEVPGNAPDPKPEPEAAPDPIPEPEPQPEEPTTTASKESVQTGNEVVEELKATIKELQQQNIKKDNSANVPDPQAELDELVRAYM